MARIVILSFSDNSEAEEFVRSSPTGTRMRIEAVVARPTSWCRCPATNLGSRRRRSSKRESAWQRGKRFGWVLCIHCRKPSEAAVRHFITTMLAGCNDLLPEIFGGESIAPHDRWVRDGGIPKGD